MPIINSIITDTIDIVNNGTYDVARYTTANVNVEGGTPPVYTTICISPSTSTETFWPSDFGGDAFESVLAEGVTSDIDSNIQPENIKKDVQILGVTGTYEGGGSNNFCKQFAIDANNKAYAVNNVIDFTGVEDVAASTFQYLYGGAPGSGTMLNTNTVDLSSLTQITGASAFKYAFYNTLGYTKVDMSNVTIIGNNGWYRPDYCCESMFYADSTYQADVLQEVDLSSLETISSYNGCAYMFSGRHNLTTVDLSNLKYLDGAYSCCGMFSGCTSLTSIDLSSLIRIGSDHDAYCMFANCTSLSSVDLSSLSEIKGQECMSCMFANCSSLRTLSFPALTSNSFDDHVWQFSYMLDGCTDVTVHFPSNLQTVIGNWDEVINGFSGTRTTVLFDLPATE